VKVGRSALDVAAIRAIEESNPDIEFDWTRILKEQGAPELPPQAPRAPGQERRSVPRRVSEPRGSRPAAPPPAGRSVEATPAAVAQPRLSEIAAQLPGEQPDSASVDIDDATPAHKRIGAEGVIRLRARHAEILARIAERVEDPTRQDELKAIAERLNPDTWVTDDEVNGGLEGYEAVLDGLRSVVGQGRRRRRRGPREEAPADDSATATSEADPAGTAAVPPGDDQEPEEEPV
jgi:hypothetical protein